MNPRRFTNAICYSSDIYGYQVAYSGKKNERNPFNQSKATDIHSATCFVYGLNVEGELGKRFIEIHHLNQIGTLKGETVIQAVKELVPNHILTIG